MTRTIFAGGISGTTERRIVAHKCVWCAAPHWFTDTDRQAHKQGAPISHGACPEAAARLGGEAITTGATA